MPKTDMVLLEVKGLTKHFPVRQKAFRHRKGMVKAVDGIDMRILEGETLGLVGESGCGKTTMPALLDVGPQHTAA